MAQTTTLEGLRSQILHSFYGRKDGLDAQEFNIGPKDIRVQVEGFNAGTSVVSTVGCSVGSTGQKLSNFGMSVVGATAASASTAYYLDVPIPGVYKSLFNPSTAAAVIFAGALTSSGGISTAGPFFCSTASVTSTHQTLTMAGKGCNVQLLALTTNLWGAMVPPGSTTSTNVSFS